MEYGDDVDVFDIPVEDGMQQLCWAIKKIAAKLKGKLYVQPSLAMWSTHSVHKAIVRTNVRT